MPWSGGNAEGPAPPRRKIRKNSSTFGKFVAVAYLPKVLLSAMHYRRGCGLSRRFAPRNGSGETSLPPLTRPSFSMSLRTSAHTCGNPFSPQKNSASWLLFGQIRSRLRIRPKYCFPSCCTARVTDCHVASLLAMTYRNMAGFSECKRALPDKPAASCRFALA